MANFHTDEWILKGLNDHVEEAKTLVNPNNIVGVFLQGSQNYNMDTEFSDIDTKLIVVPTLREIALNKKALSTTHIRDNEEHIDMKDVRLYLQCFKKQNINFVEVLFTKYKEVFPLYQDEWNLLVENREKIARYDPVAAVRSMAGCASQKYFALEHRYPSKIEVIDKYGYDPKQLHHLLRFYDFMLAYINDTPYEECLRPVDPDALKDIKLNPPSHTDALDCADYVMGEIDALTKDFCKNAPEVSPYEEEIDELFEEVLYNIIRKSIKEL